ncbi:ribokinase [Clostridiaceae bacterium HSG29]|nr:ribokinase [Clostridiaceae bacterium HSG29]
MITVLGSLNMDLVTQVNITPVVGETVLGDGLNNIPGGKGGNQAAAIGKLGGNVRMLGKVGNDAYGVKLIESLNESGVNIENIQKSDKSTGLAFIMVNNNGDNSIVVIPGANFDINEEDVLNYKGLIETSDILVSQLETPLDVVEKSFEIAKKSNTFTILNPAPAKKLNKSIISLTDLLTPNESELELLSGIKINTENDLLDACEAMLNSGVKNLIVTLGEKGSLFYNSEGYEKFEALKVKAIDTTAAGDSFTGAIAFCVDNGESIKDAIKTATNVAAFSVTKKGAQSSLPTLEELKEFMGE